MLSVITTTYNTPPHILARTWTSTYTKMIYKQHIGPMTAQRQRNEQIQEFVAKIRANHPQKIYGIE
jgi:hypothetical protein